MLLPKKPMPLWKPLSLLAIGLILTLILTSCSTNSTPDQNSVYCAATPREQCTDKACAKRQLVRYCLCEKETTDLPKSVYCEVGQ